MSTRDTELHDNTADQSTMDVSLMLYTPSQAAELLAVKESWIRRKAGRRAIPCTFLGKHLRFSADDLRRIVESGSQPSQRRPAQRHMRLKRAQRT